MDQNDEIRALREQLAEMRAALDEMKASASRANSKANALEEAVLTLATEITDAQDKVNTILLQNPGIAEDIAELERILGPADRVFPNAPRRS